MLYEDVDVSVPYRGLIFLNQYNNIKCAGMPKFPSPTGDLYFSMAVKIEIAKSFKKVSVPYRGLIFLNGSAWGGIEPPYTVSVPYRGLIFLNLVSLVIDFLHNQFPSPTGDLYFSMQQ